MASSLISRSHHIDFDSVFRFDDAGIVQMFESLVSTGLMEFLGCPAIFHEQALIEFFENGSVRDGMVVSTISGTAVEIRESVTISGTAVEIRESVFAVAFGLPTEGLTDLSEVPRDLLSNAQKLFSASEKEVSISCLKKEVKMPFRLLSDILAKSLFVKAGSFDAVTRDRFLLMTAITFDVKVNWGNLLFGVLKEMVTPDSRQAKGYAIQICVLLKNIPGLELGPAIFSRVDQAEQLYFVQSPVSPPAAFSHQESSSSSSDVSIHFDSEDLLMRNPEAAHTSAPVDSNVSTAALEDLRSYFSKRIDESTYELRSKVNEVEFNVRGDLVKQQAWLRQTFQNACDILERQSTQISDLKKGLVAPVGTIFQDLFDIKKNQRAHEAKLNALDGQVAALRNDQLEFQNRISADLLSLSTQFADIVEFIRGGDAKKGESGSSSRPPPVRVERRPLPTPQSPRDVAGGSSAVRIPTFPRTTGTFAERVEQARRHILESGLVISVEEAAERIRQADIQESDRLQRERERARREKRSSSSRRRRGF
ncbi:hypothetical protein F511_42272 [Dorcoceras hygrometricum]|uniref:Dystroglycan-like n=1 Tax=Dorcoceras hygrometricum TaxID=472368 RepID=A0A2Z7B047_9LAMI|nr:hypothetical protein F511_42272 [Dorcoceras hygrometricum]